MNSTLNRTLEKNLATATEADPRARLAAAIKRLRKKEVPK